MYRFCKLLPTNKRNKQLIKQYGDKWFLVKEREIVQCFDDKEGYLIMSQDRKNLRWVVAKEISEVSE